MANVKNWQPDMTEAERAWFNDCPKGVLFEMCRQLAMLAQGEENPNKAFSRMQEEWSALHTSRVVPQKPHDVPKETAKRIVLLKKQAAFRAAHPAGVRLGDTAPD